MTDGQCIAQVVCSALKIKSEDWHIFKETVKDAIRIRRANSNSAMKKEFHGELEYCYGWVMYLLRSTT